MSAMAFVAPGALLSRPQLHTEASHGLAGVLPRSVQDDALLSSSSWMCIAVLVGAATVARRRATSAIKREGFLTRAGPARTSRVALYVCKNHWWYGPDEDEPRAPSWLKDWKPSEEDEDEGPPDKGARLPRMVPEYATLEWWKNLPPQLQQKDPYYWNMYFNKKGKPKFQKKKLYMLPKAVDILYSFYKDLSYRNPTIQLNMNMNLNANYPDQQIRTFAVLPHGLGAERKIAVWCSPDEEKEALDMGADIAGKTLSEELTKEIINFDVLITKPAGMPALAKLGKLLGPRKLMPSPKTGTVVTEFKAAIDLYKGGGQIQLRNNSYMKVKTVVGRLEMGKEKITENIRSLLQQMADKAPEGAKKIKDFWRVMYIKGHDSPAVRIDPSEWPSHGFTKTTQKNIEGPLAVAMGLA